MSEIMFRLNQAEQACRADSEDTDRGTAERAFYLGKAEGYRLAAEWLLDIERTTR